MRKTNDFFDSPHSTFNIFIEYNDFDVAQSYKTQKLTDHDKI